MNRHRAAIIPGRSPLRSFHHQPSGRSREPTVIVQPGWRPVPSGGRFRPFGFPLPPGGSVTACCFAFQPVSRTSPKRGFVAGRQCCLHPANRWRATRCICGSPGFVRRRFAVCFPILLRASLPYRLVLFSPLDFRVLPLLPPVRFTLPTGESCASFLSRTSGKMPSYPQRADSSVDKSRQAVDKSQACDGPLRLVFDFSAPIGATGLSGLSARGVVAEGR